MLSIDHISLGCRSICEGTERLCDETGSGQYEGGCFPHLGIANRIVPLGPDQYIEVESVIDAYSPQTNPSARWFYDQIERGDVYIGLVPGRRLARRTDQAGTALRHRHRRQAPAQADGRCAAQRVHETIPCRQQGLPIVFLAEEGHAVRARRRGLRSAPEVQRRTSWCVRRGRRHGPGRGGHPAHGGHPAGIVRGGCGRSPCRGTATSGATHFPRQPECDRAKTP
ncbi:VOC family protein [Streptomyces sp. NPDC001848]|uniref:VOC family protein n=1 Tax=Streptomyces sp. NPDC001848 TaxID=3364618 RepID=UPI00367E90F5